MQVETQVTDATPDRVATPVAARILGAVAQAYAVARPYTHWLLDDILPVATVKAIVDLPFDPPGGARFDGRRESNNSSRVYFSPAIQSQFSVCAAVADAFRTPSVVAALSGLTGVPLVTGRLRIEYCQDVDGFWLEPHVDLPVKMFTLLVYLSDDPGLADAGTDIYDSSPDHRPAGRADYAANKALIFIPGQDTWHGFTPRPVRGVRKSLIVNYVTDAWRAVEELA